MKWFFTMLVFVTFSTLKVNSKSEGRYLNIQVSNRISPIFEYGEQFKCPNFRISIPRPWRNFKYFDSDFTYNIYYKNKEVLYFRVYNYKKKIVNDSVMYFINDRPLFTDDYWDYKPFFNEYISPNDTCWIPDDDQLIDFISSRFEVTRSISWQINHIKSLSGRKNLIYMKGNAEFLLFNIKPKNFDKYFEVIKSYEELDKPNGW